MPHTSRTPLASRFLSPPQTPSDGPELSTGPFAFTGPKGGGPTV